jgi:hypothetical protein
VYAATTSLLEAWYLFRTVSVDKKASPTEPLNTELNTSREEDNDDSVDSFACGGEAELLSVAKQTSSSLRGTVCE